MEYVLDATCGHFCGACPILRNGGKKCDFRFSKAGNIQEGWLPTLMHEFKP